MCMDVDLCGVCLFGVMNFAFCVNVVCFCYIFYIGLCGMNVYRYRFILNL